MAASNQATSHWERIFAEHHGAEQGWLATLRSEAFAEFAEQGFPRPKAQGWRHTNVNALARTAFEIATGDGGDASPLPAIEGSAVRAVFVDGRLRPDLSDLPAVDGLLIESLRDALDKGDADLQAHLRKGSARTNGSFTALNTALMEDGAVVRLARGAVVKGPVHLVFVTTSSATPTSTHLRNLVIAEDLAQATVVEHYTSPDGQADFTNAVTDVVAGPGSHLLHARVQEEGDEAWHVADLDATIARDAHLVSLSVALGGRLSRTGIHTVLDGEGAQCDLLGLYLGRGDQHHDHTTLIEHARPHGTSREVYKGILDGASRGVFTGIVKVAEQAQKTNAEQSNRNLLLSDRAHADSEPMLEIHADDVKCAHGSAIGRLDDDALFYLRARGIGIRQARRLLTHAFAAEVVDAVDEPGLKGLVEERLAGWLGALDSEETA